jgi:hypothetical protein
MAHIAAPSLLHREGHSIGFNLGVIALLVALLGLAVGYLVSAAARTHAASQGTGMVARTLGSAALTIPAAWLTDSTETQSFSKQIDLAVSLPLGPDGAMRRVDITLTQRSRVLPSARLLDGVYLHEFTADQLAGPPGLIGKPLLAQEGYENETVWYDPINVAPFVAKCAAPIAPGATARCLRLVYVRPGIAAIYGFDQDVLGNWRKFDAEMHPLLDKIGAV